MPTSHVNPAVSTVPPWAVQQRIGTTAARYALNSMLMPRTDAGLSYTDYRSGVMASGDGDNTHLAMRVQAGNGMSVTVAQGNAVINTPNQGAYMCCLDSAKTLTIPASSATTNRYDLVVACVYDDNNTALSGSSGVRQFAVELVQGDAATGLPAIPSVPVGCIPLASIYVGKSVTDLTGTDPGKTERNAAIQDLRGPGIVARGGMRALYGADAQQTSTAYQQPGAYPGDQRWIHTSGFQHQVYYGQSQGWRGVHNALVYNARPKSNLMSTWILNTGSTRELCRVTIPYPGTPFMVYPSATVFADLSKRTSADHYVAVEDKAGAVITAARRDSGDAIEDTRQGWECTPIMWGPFTDTVDLVLCARVWSAALGSHGVGFRWTPPEHSIISVIVYPSTVQPPAW